MNPLSQVIITGPLNDSDDQTYWDNQNQRWSADFEDATWFRRARITDPLPEGATGVLEMGHNAQCVAFLTPLPVGGA